MINTGRRRRVLRKKKMVGWLKKLLPFLFFFLMDWIGSFYKKVTLRICSCLLSKESEGTLVLFFFQKFKFV